MLPRQGRNPLQEKRIYIFTLNFFEAVSNELRVYGSPNKEQTQVLQGLWRKFMAKHPQVDAPELKALKLQPAITRLLRAMIDQPTEVAATERRQNPTSRHFDLRLKRLRSLE
jgi:hypothetical protein